VFYTDVGPPDLEQNWGGLPDKKTTPDSIPNNRDDFETSRLSSSKIPIFSPSAQSRLHNFIEPDPVADLRILPGDVYGLGNPSLLRIAEDKIEPAQSEQKPAEAPLVHTFGINEEISHDHLNRKKRKGTIKLKQKQWLKNPKIGQTKRVSEQLLRAAGYDDLADKIHACGQQHLVKVCQSCRQQGNPFIHGVSHTIDPCELTIFCPDCAKHRAGRAKKRYSTKLAKFAHVNRLLYTPVFITLTIKSGWDLDERLDVLLDSFRRLRDRQAWSHIAAAISSVEITVSRRHGWHPHLHILAFRRAFWDHDELTAEWLSSTRGEGYIADIRQLKGDLKKAIAECVKYVTKPMSIEDLGVEQVHELVSLRRRQLMSTLGDLRGFEVTESDQEEFGDPADFDPCDCLVCGKLLCEVPISSVELERMSCVVVSRGP